MSSHFETSIHTDQWSYHGIVNEDGVPHGSGLKTWTGRLQRHKYDGEFREGRMHGRGTFVWPHASCYRGEWRDDARSGQGLMWLGDGRRCFEGEWEFDCPLTGTAVDPDGGVFLAKFGGGEPLGDESWRSVRREPAGRILNWPPSEYDPGGPRGRPEWRAGGAGGTKSRGRAGRPGRHAVRTFARLCTVIRVIYPSHRVEVVCTSSLASS